MRKGTCLTIIIILLISTLAIYIPSIPVEAGSSGPDYPPPIAGDWVITGDTSVWDETIIVNGSLIVTETGRLTLINCVLKVNSTFDGQYKIQINSTGELYVYDSTITPYDTAYKYRFEVYGRLWTNHSTIEYMWGDENNPPYVGGIQIYDARAEVWLNHTKVTRSGANGIHAENVVGVNITGNCNITGNTRAELYAINSKYFNLSYSNFTDYIDARVSNGVWFQDSEYIIIDHSYIAHQPGDQIYLWNVSYSTVSYNDIGVGAGIVFNVGQGINVRDCDTTLRISWNNISENGVGGIGYRTKSSPIIENNHIYENGGGIGNANAPEYYYCDFYIFNNTIENNTGSGIIIFTSNATIINNTFWGNNIRMWNSYAWIEDSTFPNIDMNASSPFIVNSTSGWSSGLWTNLDNDSHPFTVNCTLNNWDQIYNWDPLSNLTVQNYLHTRVLDSDGFTPISNAWVNITDNGNPMFSGQTDINGEVQWIAITNRTYLYDYWSPFHPFENISYNETIVHVEKGNVIFIDNPRTVGMDTNHWEIFQVDPQFNISLSEGWNLISFPLVQSDESLDKVLESIDGKWDYIMAYNATDPDHWKTNGTFMPDQLNDLKKLNHKMGFWINITESNVNLTVKGCLPTSTSIPLYAGWNLVGYPTLNDSETVANALWGTGADRVEVFNATAPYRIKEVGATYVMKPGEGYWVHVPANSVWIINW